MQSKLALGSLSGIAGIPNLGVSPAGGLLIAAGNEILEVGLLGNLIKRTAFGTSSEPISFFSAARRGRTLITSSAHKKICEYSPGGNLLYAHQHESLHRPIYARRLRDGKLIVAQHSTDENESAIISYDAEGDVHWTFTPSREIGLLTAAAALSNGNALYGSSTGLYEIGNGGRIIRTWINGPVSFVYAD